MMSLASIKQQNREVAARAAQEGLEPFVYFDVDEVRESTSFPFPFIGAYRPEGWTLVAEHFADSSGLGADDEPALSARQLRALIEEKILGAGDDVVVGWAVIEAGQFQAYVGEFHKAAR